MTTHFPPPFALVRILILAFIGGASVVSAQSSIGRDRTSPTAPTNLIVTATTEHSVSLTWSPSTDNSGRFNYLITGTGTTVTVGQGQTSHTIDGLQSGKTYTIRVYARDVAGNLSKSSNPVTVTLPGQVAAPTKPAVAVVDVGPTHVALTWSSTDDGPTIWYSIYIDGQPVATLNSKAATFTCAAVLVPTYCDPINQDTTYTFTVRARDVDGNWSPVSDPVLVTTDPINPNDQAPPTPPANLTAESNGGFLTVRWDASTDDFAPQSFIRYDVYINGQLNAVVVGQTTAEVEVYFGENTITVIAVDTADNESAPSTVAVVH
jgi:chitodextrinase